MKSLTILGSTGSIGTQAIEVCEALGYRVDGLSANRNVSLLEKQARSLHVKEAVIADESRYGELKLALKDTSIRVSAGEQALCRLAAENDSGMVLNSVVGMTGLKPTLAAISAGKDIALANKETLVTGGRLVMDAVKEKGVNLYPVDSEHSAIFQCLQSHAARRQLKKIILTASGGPFFGRTKEQLYNVTVADALKHPNWSMGAKITVDSATLMNKALEFTEAVFLFDVQPEQIEIVVHRQSVLHSAVEFVDCSVIGQMGVPDMKIPIQYALTYPDRVPSMAAPLSLTDYGTLTFEKPDYDTFRCLAAGIRANELGGTMPAIANGANEQAVALFLEGKISFLQIGELVEAALELPYQKTYRTVEEVYAADRAAREFVLKQI